MFETNILPILFLDHCAVRLVAMIAEVFKVKY